VQSDLDCRREGRSLNEETAPRRRRLLRPLLLAGWLALIFGTSCTVVRPEEFFGWLQKHLFVSDDSMERFRAFWDVSWYAIVKGWHATEFGVLLLLCVAAVRCWTGRGTRGTITGSMLFCILFAISDEWHQTFVPDRLGTATDVFIDALGVCVVGAVLLMRMRRRVRRGEEGAGLLLQ
jgi:hypothetical protein